MRPSAFKRGRSRAERLGMQGTGLGDLRLLEAQRGLPKSPVGCTAHGVKRIPPGPYLLLRIGANRRQA